MAETSKPGKGLHHERDDSRDGSEERKGAAQRSAMFDQQSPDEIAGNVRTKGQDPSPDDRARGETSDKDKTPATDI